MDLIFPFRVCRRHGICFHVSLCYTISEIIYSISIKESSNTAVETLTLEKKFLCVCIIAKTQKEVYEMVKVGIYGFILVFSCQR